MTDLPHGPKGRWLTGNLPDFRRDRLAFLTRCASDYGDLVSLRFGHRRILLVNHPDAVEQVLVSGSRHFIKHFALRLNPLVLGNGLLTSDGDFWLRQRRLMQPAFQRQRVAAYAPVMVDYTERMLAEWRPGQRRDILTEMLRLTLAIAAKTLFDAEAGSKADTVSRALRVLQEAFLSKFNTLVPLPSYVPTPRNLRLRRAVRQLDEIIYGFIQQRRASGESKGDLLSLLLAARDEQDHTGMTDRQLRDEAMTLFLAGHETTALALSWTWLLLAQHPDSAARLATEVDAVVGDRAPTADDCARLVFTEKVVREALRLYPPAYMVGREAIHPCEVGDYHVPVGLTILMSPWLIHRDGRFWDQAATFDPDRWTDEQEQRRPRFAYFPFGGGPRLCIGNHFAMMEAVLVLATIARRWRFTIEAGEEIVAAPTFTLRPRPGVPAVLERRE